MLDIWKVNILQSTHVHPCGSPSVIYFPCTFLSILYIHIFSKKAWGTGPWDRNLSNARVRHTLVIPRGDIICAICGRLHDSCRRVFLGTFYGHCLAQSPLTLPGPPFIPATIFKTAGIQSKHVTFLHSILLKLKVAFLVFCPLCLVMRQVWEEKSFFVVFFCSFLKLELLGCPSPCPWLVGPHGLSLDGKEWKPAKWDWQLPTVDSSSGK